MKTEILKFDNLPTVITNHHVVTSKSLLWSPPHVHDEIEILYVLAETLTCQMSDGAKVVLSAGDVAIFNQNVIHETLSTIGCEYYMLQIPCVTFSADPSLHLLPFKTQAFSLPYVFFDQTNEKGNVLKEYIRHLFTADAQNRLFTQGYVTLIMAFLQKIQMLPLMEDIPVETIQKLQPALQYLIKHFREKITTKDVAQELNFHPDYFERLFKNAFDVTVTDYVNNLRINEAKKLLCLSRKTIEEIADCCGFSSAPYLNKIFKKYTSLTPSAYRKFKQKTYHPDTYGDKPEYKHLLQ